MLVRIVKLGFHQENVDTFLANFEEDKSSIRGFKGCQLLELYRDNTNLTIFFTYSYWDDEAALEAYRHSDFFKRVWAKTKPLFNRPPEAWSVGKLATLD